MVVLHDVISFHQSVASFGCMRCSPFSIPRIFVPLSAPPVSACKCASQRQRCAGTRQDRQNKTLLGLCKEDPTRLPHVPGPSRGGPTEIPDSSVGASMGDPFEGAAKQIWTKNKTSKPSSVDHILHTWRVWGRYFGRF